MEEYGIDFYVSVNPDNIFYLTNFANYVHERPFIFIVSKSGRAQFIIPKLEAPHVSMRAIGDFEQVIYAEFPAKVGDQWIDRFRAIIPVGAKIGIESTAPYYVANAVPEGLVCLDLLDDIRMVKSSYDLVGKVS